MGNDKRSGSSGRISWPVRLTTAAGAGVGAAIALFVVKPLVEPQVWLGLITFIVLVGAGSVLGQFVGELLFRPSSGEPPDQPRN